jgi:hypothetical protein
MLYIYEEKKFCGHINTFMISSKLFKASHGH